MARPLEHFGPFGRRVRPPRSLVGAAWTSPAPGTRSSDVSRPDGLAPARGIVIGVALSAALWLGIIAAIRAIT